MSREGYMCYFLAAENIPVKLNTKKKEPYGLIQRTLFGKRRNGSCIKKGRLRDIHPGTSSF